MTHTTSIRINTKEFKEFSNNVNSPSLSKFINAKVKEFNEAQRVVAAAAVASKQFYHEIKKGN